MRNYEKLKEQVNTAIDSAKSEAAYLHDIAAEARRISNIAREVFTNHNLERQVHLITLK
jgi:hypothetical protein